VGDKCPGCGTQSYEDGAFEARTLKCLNCQKLEMKRADVYDTDPPVPGRSGVHILLRRTDADT
jgi:hypothetical protein